MSKKREVPPGPVPSVHEVFQRMVAIERERNEVHKLLGLALDQHDKTVRANSTLVRHRGRPGGAR